MSDSQEISLRLRTPRSGSAIADPAHAVTEGIRAFVTGDYPQAMRRFEAALATDPANPRILAACGHTCRHRGENERALEFYDRSEVTSAALDDVRFCRAILRIRAGLVEQASEDLKTLFANPPEVVPGSFYLGMVYTSTAEFRCDIALHLGTVYRERNDSEEARRWFQRALEAKPDSVPARQRLAEVAILSKSYVEAIRHLDEIIASSTFEEDLVNAHNNLGIAHYENGALEEAIKHLTWVLQRLPANPSAVHNLNFIYEREGLFSRNSGVPPAIRFMDVAEGALPIFALTEAGSGPSGEGIEMIGRSSEMLRTMRHARLAAANGSPVLILGESGTGKTLLARMIALNSEWRDGPFTIVDCTQSEMVLESELFGHEKGAFTGARASKPGQLELSAGGTLLLKEVSAISPHLQGKILRALQDKQFLPMGASRPMPLNLRLICSTKRPLAQLVSEGQFREDLYYALNVLPIAVPPLRERREDIGLLADYFLHKHARHSDAGVRELPVDDLHILMEYDWPGNVRELENLMERAVVMGSQSNLYLEELARLRRGRELERRARKQAPDSAAYPLQISLAELERRHILAVLESVEGNQKRASQILGINPSTLWRKLKGFGVEE